MSYDLFLIPRANRGKIDSDFVDRLTEEPTPDEIHAVTMIAPDVQRAIEAHGDGAEWICVNESDGVFEVNLTYNPSAGSANRMVGAMLDVIADLSRRFDLCVFDLQFDRIIDPVKDRRRILKQFGAGRALLEDISSLQSSGAGGQKSWWKFWTR